jgi:hypothetical protein
MRRRNNRKAAGAVVITGLATLASLGLMQLKSGPALPPHTMPNDAGIKSSMLWLELAVDRDEVFANLGPSTTDEGVARRRQLDTINYYDFGFMVCYSEPYLLRNASEPVPVPQTASASSVSRIGTDPRRGHAAR